MLSDDNGWGGIPTKIDDIDWDELVPKDLADIVFDSELLTDRDMEDASEEKNPDFYFWRLMFLRKIARSVEVLAHLGLDVRYNVMVIKEGTKRRKHSSPFERLMNK